MSACFPDGNLLVPRNSPPSASKSLTTTRKRKKKMTEKRWTTWPSSLKILPKRRKPSGKRRNLWPNQNRTVRQLQVGVGEVEVLLVELLGEVEVVLEKKNLEVKKKSHSLSRTIPMMKTSNRLEGEVGVVVELEVEVELEEGISIFI